MFLCKRCLKRPKSKTRGHLEKERQYEHDVGEMYGVVYRVAMLLAGVNSIRDVIAFPKTTAARALFEDAPNVVDDAELRALGLDLRKP